MRIASPRLTVGRSMVAVAIAGLLLGLWRRSVALELLAKDHEARAAREASDSFHLTHHITPVSDANRRRSGELMERRAYHLRLASTYHAASRRPWLPVPPDPPEPE